MRKILLLLCAVITLCITESKAAHLVGGELSYECVGPDQYLLTLKIYRDCNSTGAPFDASAPISIWNSQGVLEQNLFIDFPLAGSDTLELVDLNPCLVDTPDVCVETAIYETLVILPQSVVGDYIIAYQRCCRNNTISNILNPGDTGSTYWVTIPSDTTVQCNSSPTFDNFPPIVICADQPIVFDHSATDLDGDSLVYRMCDPFEGADITNPAPAVTSPPPFSPITWLAPYGTNNQIGGFPQLSVDPVSGQLVGYPDTPGQFVVGVCVDEYRDGILLGSTIRDFQFNVTVCGIDEVAEVEAQIGGAVVTDPEGCAPFTVDLFNVAAPNADSFWDFGDGSTTDTDQPTYTYDTPGVYIITLTAEDSASCVIIDSSFLQITVLNCIVCPDSLLVTGPSEGCDGASISLGLSTLPADSLASYVCTDAAGNVVDPSNITLENNGCAPLEVAYTVTASCLDDPSIILTEVHNLTVFPSDISPFIDEDVTDCSVQMLVDPDCADFIEVTPGAVVQPGDEGSLDITATYLPSSLCAPDVITTLDYDCPNCTIDNISAAVQACNGTDFMVELDLGGIDLGTSFTVTDAAGAALGTFNYADLPVMIGPFFGDEVSTYTVTVTDDTDGYCQNTVTFGPVDCLPCSISATEISTYCSGTEYFVDVDVSSTNSSDSFEVDGFGSFLYADSPVTIGPFPSSEVDINTLIITDSEEADCTTSIDVGPLGCYICDIDNVIAPTRCIDEDSFEVLLSFTGSNTYTISDGVNVMTGVSAGNEIYIGLYPDNSSDVTITITDELADNCVYTVVALSRDCNCNSVGGTIMVNSMNVCPDDLSITDADDFLLEPGQSVYYLYHNQPVVAEGNLPDLVSDVYTTGSFLTNDGSTIPCGQTVYVTAIGAYEDLTMPGFPDYGDYCLTLSNTIPINFLCPIVITVDETCDKSSGEFTYSFMVSGGLPQIIPGEDYDVTGDYYTGTAALSGSVVVGPIPDLASYTVTATDANGCSGTITRDVECEKVPIELLSFSGEALDNGNYIQWETATEIENELFTLYRSNDGLSYTEIAKVNGAGTTASAQKYNHMDKGASDGISYYRLTQTDLDGTINEVGVISVSRSNSSIAIAITDMYPLPAAEYINIQVNSNSKNLSQINIIDISGRTLWSDEVMLNSGENMLHIDLENISGGAYLIEIIGQNETISERFIVN